MSTVCSVTGKIHYKTFDGTEFTLLSQCAYKLIMDPNTLLGVNIINDPNTNNNSTVKRKVHIITEENAKILLSPLPNGKISVKVNDELVALPYDDAFSVKEVGSLHSISSA